MSSTRKTNADTLREIAEQQAIPLRTLDDVRAALAEAHKRGAGSALARLMLRHGRLTDEARAFVAREYPGVQS